jgi:micrococcal nuclease
MGKLLLVAVLAAAPVAALADFTGRVVNVSDGDTLTVLVKKKQIRVRLESIDAPESKQAFGKRSQQSLAQLCAAKPAWVIDTGAEVGLRPRVAAIEPKDAAHSVER